MPFKDTKEGSTHYFGDNCIPRHLTPAEEDILKAAQESSCLQRIQMIVWKFMEEPKHERNSVKMAEEIFEDVKETLEAQETVICAAVVSTTGKIIRGHRHNNCLATLRDMRLGYQYGDGTTQGFITSNNRYVNRKEAMEIQKAAGIESLDPGGYRGGELYSEDLY